MTSSAFKGSVIWQSGENSELCVTVLKDFEVMVD